MSTELLQDIINDNKKFIEVAKMAFDSVDVKKTGQIEAGELEKIMSQIAGELGSESPTKVDVLELLRYLDDDESGKISFEEFKQLIYDILNKMIDEE